MRRPDRFKAPALAASRVEVGQARRKIVDVAAGIVVVVVGQPASQLTRAEIPDVLQVEEGLVIVGARASVVEHGAEGTGRNRTRSGRKLALAGLAGLAALSGIPALADDTTLFEAVRIITREPLMPGIDPLTRIKFFSASTE